ncbi:hypothetical protein BN873_890059 [Candidatus Competibacter denitrificans Run_A_D11]|uniref:Uncharacterized protein n=1 Tax=Candidatus Competibacter denitrificans Run_A_D11 TaxID=1400863 RepID=W6ME81_9GAMM|nr:hypothetical protein [Candidatus Competibacter denitrificans]CDI04153.1 hypothetical protein BN873_890059 [Candidatus Competibacter denitrificans Run_A_D11]HAS86796.1 hypothetical protein [Candidatus Competibacteraceae bacterium]HRC70008.1 hypothetical protein [Candidatus Competibacter denitrificans]
MNNADLIDCDALVAELNRKYERWNLYRIKFGFAITLRNNKYVVDAYTVDDPLLSECLRKAVAIVPIPRIPPRPPETPVLEAFHNHGKQWIVLDKDRYYQPVYCLSQKEAEAKVPELLEIAKKRKLEWDDRYLELVRNGQHGVDFLFTKDPEIKIQ